MKNDNIINDNCVSIPEKKIYVNNLYFNQQTKLVPIFLIIIQKLFGFSDFNFKINPPFKKQTMNNTFNRNNSFTFSINLGQYFVHLIKHFQNIVKNK